MSKEKFPLYYMSKNKIQLTPTTDVDGILRQMAERYKNEKVTTKSHYAVETPRGEFVLIVEGAAETKKNEAKTALEEADRLAETMLDDARKMI